MRKDRIADLGELQLELLDVLERIGEATVYDLMDGFPPESRPKYSTVQTAMRSLEKRGLATHRTEGRTFIFSTLARPRSVRAQILRDVRARVFGGSPKALVAALLDAEDLTAEDIAALRALLDDREAEGDDD